MKNKLLKRLLIAIGLLIASINTVWATNTYYITGPNSNIGGWGTWKSMTVSEDGYYEYFQAASGNCECKINTKEGYDNPTAMGDGYISHNFNGTNLGSGNSWTSGGNINYWYNSGTYYVICYYPNTRINDSDDPVVCASTSLPQDGRYIGGDGTWCGAAWTTTGTSTIMTDNGSGVFTKDVSLTASTSYKFKISTYDWRTSWGWNASTVSKSGDIGTIGDDNTNDHNIKFTPNSTGTYTISYDISDNTIVVSAPETTYSITCYAGANGSITARGTAISAGSNAIVQVGSTSRTLTATPATGYHFAGWTKTGSVTIADASSTSTTMTATGTGTVTATWAANTVYFVNSEKWSTVKIYGWDGASYGDWPGTAMTDAGFDVTIDGRTYDVYKKEQVPAGSHIIFNNGEANGSSSKKQTADLSADDAIGKYFFADECFGAGTDPSPKPDGTFYASTSAVEAAHISCYQDHRVTFGVVGSTGGTLAGTNTTTSSSISSGAIVGLTNAISLTATPSSGYAIEGWYTDAAGSDLINHNKTAYTKTFTGSDEDLSVYVKFEALHTVTLSATNGKIQIGGEDATSASVASNTTATITAVPDSGYYFTGWTVPSGVTITSGTTSSATITIKSTADSKTVTANFALKWSVASTATDPEYATGVNLIGNISSAGSPKVYTGYKDISLAANTDYQFQIVNREGSSTWYGHVAEGKTDIYYADDNTAVNASTGSYNNFTLHTAAAGTYRFYWSWNSTTKQVKVDYPTSYYITSGVRTDFGATGTVEDDDEGGSITAVDNSSHDVSGGKFVASGASVTFEATANPGYEFDGWYTDEDCTTGKDMTNPLTVSSIGANVTRYAKFKEIMTQVNAYMLLGGVSIDGGEYEKEQTIYVGVHTTHTVTARADAAYYFKGWKLYPLYEEDELNFAISGDKDDEDNYSVTVRGLGAPDSRLQMLDGLYGTLERIYFRNKFDDGSTVTSWDHVYVYFDVTESAGRVVTSAKNSDSTLHVEMTAMGYYGIYYATVPRHITRYGKSKVAFANFDNSGNSYTLWPGSGSSNHGQAVYRTDYNAKNNMFVPYHTPTSTCITDDGGNTDYFNNGYWIFYATGLDEGKPAGYYIERRTGNNTYSGRATDCEFRVLEDVWTAHPKIQFSLRIDGITNDKYVIFNEAGKKYRLAGANKDATSIRHDNCTDLEMIEDNDNDEYFILTPTAEGEYIITLDQGSDRMKITVEYPIVAGDYVIENAFNDGSAKTTRSNVIKASKAGTKTRYSMYLNNAGSGTLKLRKCTEINASGVPVWSTGDNTNLQSILNNPEFTKGVYQFDIAVSGDAVSEIDSVRLYTGDYYIKTDAADGGWVAYKKNILDKNTVNFDRTSATYDNYFCKYFSSKDCNIKSVIANDYCNQLSDTVKGDGIARMVGTEPYVPVDGTSIRFSYNSATNETKRAYLGASEKNDFLNLVEDQAAEKVYRKIDATTYDLHNISGYDNLWKTKFADNGNWVYEMELKVKPSAQAGVSAAYTDASKTKHDQVLIPSTNTVLGGSSSSTNLYSIRIVYDFKTNFMMSSFVLTEDEITEDLSDFDMLWIRHKDAAATQLNLGDNKKLTNVRVVGAIELRYDSVHWRGTGEHHVDLYTWNPISRPYLKYFVSFPFDVQVSSIFGLNQAKLGTDYIIQGYNGAQRAADGLFLGDGDTYWDYLTEDSIMHAGQGYYVIFDNYYANGMSGHIWDNKSAGSSVYMYFPAMEEIATIDNTNQTSIVPKHTCTIDRAWNNNKDKNHMNTDSHWNTIGSPLFHNSYINGYATAVDTALTSYYYLDNPIYGTQPTWMVQAIKDAPMFKAMSAVLVQWAGTITWTTTVTNIFEAPRRKVADEKSYFIKLDMLMNGELRDWTYLDLKEGAVADFLLNEDMSKVNNRGVPNIYSFAGAYDVAYNTLPIENQTIPVGMIIRKAGTYTFSMPYNFSGTVTLIDTYAQTRTNLAIEDYEVELSKGTIDDRFLLEININKVPTAIDGAKAGEGTLKDGKVHKFIMNDQMYILKDGVLYDARGNRVK